MASPPDHQRASGEHGDEPDAPRRPWLSAPEAWSRLAASHTGVFTTLRGDGWPISLPVWFAVIDRRIYIRSPHRAKKVVRIGHDSRASFLVESGERWRDLFAVHLTGRARVVDHEDPIAEVGRVAIETKYSGFSSAPDSLPDETRAHYGRGFVVIVFEADERIISWDNSRLFA